MKQLSKMERAFVVNYHGNAAEAARAAGYRMPVKQGYRLMQRAHVRAALALQEKVIVEHNAKLEAKKLTRVSITRNEVINILADVARKGKSESARVSACGHLKDIFRLSPKDAVKDEFANWTDDELLAFAERGEYPARLRRHTPTRGSEKGPLPPPEGQVN